MTNHNALNQESLSKFSTWIQTKPQLAFFAPLVLGTKFKFVNEEYLMGRFGSRSLVVTDANAIFLAEEFLTSITLKQGFYLLMNSVLQIAHLHPFRLIPIYHPEKTVYTSIDTDILQACCNIAAMLHVNYELNTVPNLNYFHVMGGCSHIMATVTPDNYWKQLGWEKKADIPKEIKDFSSLTEETVEGLAHLFIRHHNPGNPPRQPQPLWGMSSDKERDGVSMDTMKTLAKNLVRKGVECAKEASDSGNSVFCPYNLDDLHLLDTVRINYRHFLDEMLTLDNQTWLGYEFDRRDLNNKDYKMTTGSDEITCILYVDTSGSLFNSVKEVLQEAISIVRVRSSRFLIKYFNSNIEKQKEENWVTDTTVISDINLPKTSGGTNWEPIVKDIHTHHRDANVIIITDGYFFDPVYYPPEHSAKLLMVMTENYNKDIDWKDLGFLVGYSDIPD